MVLLRGEMQQKLQYLNSVTAKMNDNTESNYMCFD